MFAKIKTAALSAIIALGAFAAAPSVAQAADVRIGIQVGSGYGPSWGPGWGHGPRWRDARCTPAKAMKKARRMGMNRTWVDRVSPNRIVIKGRKNGHRATIAFGRAPSCPVRNWR